MSPTLIHYPMDHFNFLSLLFITSDSNIETWLSPAAVHVFSCSILVYILAVSKFLTHTAVRNNYQLEYSAYAEILLPFIL